MARQDKYSTRGTCVTPKACHKTMSSPSIERLDSIHFGSLSGSCTCIVYSPDGKRPLSSYWVTHKFTVANLPFKDTVLTGPVNRVGMAAPMLNKMSLNATGFFVKGFNFPMAFAIFHDRAVVESAHRIAS